MEILNTYTIETPTFSGLAMWIPIVVGFIIGIWLTYKETESIGLSIFLGFWSSVLGAFIGYLLSMWVGPFTETKRYEVTFDDEIPIVEVIENYNIINQRGQIFILEDKEISE